MIKLLETEDWQSIDEIEKQVVAMAESTLPEEFDFDSLLSEAKTTFSTPGFKYDALAIVCNTNAYASAVRSFLAETSESESVNMAQYLQNLKAVMTQTKQKYLVNNLLVGFCHSIMNAVSPIVGYLDIEPHSPVIPKSLENINICCTGFLLRLLDRETAVVFHPLDVINSLISTSITIHGKPKETAINELPQILGFPYTLTEVLQNLVDNSEKSMKEKEQAIAQEPLPVKERYIPKLKINLTCEDKHIAIYFTDNGKGLEPEEEKHLFVRGESGFACRNLPGTGEGLFFCRNELKRIGGSIELAENKYKDGCTFCIRIPFFPPGL